MSKTKSLLKRRDTENNVKTEPSGLAQDKFRGYLITDLNGVRRIDGMILIQALIWNLGTSRSNDKGKIQVAHTIENESTNVEHWDGTPRSSGEVCESKWSKGGVLFSFTRRSTIYLGGVCE